MLGIERIKQASRGKSKSGSSATSRCKPDSITRPATADELFRSRSKLTRQQREEDIAGEGGFIREAALPDKLRKFQENAAIDLDLNYWQN
mmetsp:Transcript_9095/g.18386  ORF Transcript_9095/g.18386 Transcript_9095/m.18386 type:complete len:90 (-) Transcript_9095:17-286(-)